MTLLAFFLIRLVPGDPIETLAGERGIDPVRHAELLKAYGLDQPVLVQYGIYIGRVLQGDLGKSIITHEPVLNEFLALFPATIELALCAMVFGLLLGLHLRERVELSLSRIEVESALLFFVAMSL